MNSPREKCSDSFLFLLSSVTLIKGAATSEWGDQYFEWVSCQGESSNTGNVSPDGYFIVSPVTGVSADSCRPKGEVQCKAVEEAAKTIPDFNPNKVITRLPLTPSNLKIKEEIEALFDRGFKQVSFFPILDEEWDKHFHYAVFRKELKKLADWYIDAIRHGEVIPLVSTNRMLQQYEAAQKGGKRPENPCNNRSMVVGPDGTIMPCRHQLTKKGWTIGDVYKGINKVRLDAYDSAVYSSFSGCKVCEAKMVCAGPCISMIKDYGYNLNYPIKAHCIFTKAHYEAVKYIYHSLDMEDNQTFRNILKK